MIADARVAAPSDAVVGTRNGYATFRGEYVRACQLENPETMFPDDRADNHSPEVQAAKQVCNRCFFKEKCGQEALQRSEPHGVWGGMSLRDRLALKRRHYRRLEATAGDQMLEVAL